LTIPIVHLLYSESLAIIVVFLLDSLGKSHGAYNSFIRKVERKIAKIEKSLPSTDEYLRTIN